MYRNSEQTFLSVLSPIFGDKIPEDNDIKRIMHHARPLTGVEVHIVLGTAYDKVYGISAHDDPNKPSSLMGLHPAEDTFLCNPLYERMEHFAEKKVGSRFNISFDAFIELPGYYCDMMFEIAEKMNAVDGNQVDAFNQLMGKPVK